MTNYLIIFEQWVLPVVVTTMGGVIIASTIIVAVPFIIPDVPTIWQRILQAICAVAAVYSGGQSLASLTPDDKSTRHAK